MNCKPVSRKYSTRLASLLGVGLLSAALVACGGGGGGGGGGSSTPSTPNGTVGGATAVLPVGTGPVTFSFGTSGGEFVKVATTGVVSALSFPCTTNAQGFIAADLRADGMIVGLAGDIYTVDAINGNCRRIGTPSTALGSLAVASNGNFYGVSLAADSNFDFHMIVMNPSDLSVLLDVPLSGVNIGFVKGIDFAPNGNLYMSAADGANNHAVYQIDTATGAMTSRFALGNPAGDIDIDSGGLMRTGTTDQSILTYNVATGVLVNSLGLDRVTQKMLVYR